MTSHDMHPMISGDYEVGTGRGVPGKESVTGEPCLAGVPFQRVWELLGTVLDR